MDGAVLDPARDVALRGNRVQMPGQDDRPAAVEQTPRRRRSAGCPGIELAHKLDERRLVTALRGHVDELERPGWRGRGGHRSRHNDLHGGQTARSDAGPEPERGFVLAVLAQGVDPDDELSSSRSSRGPRASSRSARLVQHRAHPDPRMYVGKGKLDELKHAYKDAARGGPARRRRAQPRRSSASSRTSSSRASSTAPQLILDIFAQHAVSAEGKLQVELAQLEYNLPRMRGMWQHLERLGGGVGTRGPGESQLETDRRLARRRVSLLQERLKELSASATFAARSGAARERRPSRSPATRTSASRRS